MTIYEAAQLAHVEWVVKNKVFKVKTIHFDKKTIRFISKDERHVFDFADFDLFDSVKPILKTLDMMTNEQAKYFLQMIFESNIEYAEVEEDGISFEGSKYYYWFIEPTVEELIVQIDIFLNRFVNGILKQGNETYKIVEK